MLVDTQVLIWLVDDNPKLGDRARRLIDGRHPVYYSSMSVLEIVIKRMNGRLQVAEDISRQLDGEGFRQMPLIGEHSEALADFPELIAHDPFDRTLMAQAKTEGLQFLTADRQLLRLGYEWTIDAAV